MKRTALMTTICFLLLTSLAFAQSHTGTGTVAGRVLSADGLPQAGVRVAVITANSNAPERDASMVRITQSDSSGKYSLEDIPPGLYFIIAGPISSPSYYPGSGVPAAATAVTVTAGNTTHTLDFTFIQAGGVQKLQTVASSGKISGTVNDAMKQPIPNVTIFLTSNAPSSELFLTSTDRQGAFEISGLAAGAYTLKVSSTLNSGYQSQGYEQVTQPLTLRPDEGVRVDFRLRLAMAPGLQQSRPDLYGPIPAPGWGASISANALALETGELLRDPRSVGNHVGEVDLEVIFSNSGNLLSVRVIDPAANPDLARIAVEGIRGWRLRLSPDSAQRWTSIRTVTALYPTRSAN